MNIEVLDNVHGILEALHDGCELFEQRPDEVGEGRPFAEAYHLNSNGSVYKQIRREMVEFLLNKGAIIQREHGYEVLARSGETFDSLLPIETPLLAWKFISPKSVIRPGDTFEFRQTGNTLQFAWRVGLNALCWGKGERLARFRIEGQAWRDGPPMISSAVYPTEAMCVAVADATDVLHKFARAEIDDVLQKYPTLAGLVAEKERVLAELADDKLGHVSSDWSLYEARRALGRFNDFLGTHPFYTAKKAAWHIILENDKRLLAAEFERLLLEVVA